MSKLLTMNIRQSGFTVKRAMTSSSQICSCQTAWASTSLRSFYVITRRARILAIAGSELIHSGSQWNAANVFGSVRVLRKPFSLAAFLRIVKEQLSQEHQVTEPIL
jgi:hypothetical protein